MHSAVIRPQESNKPLRKPDVTHTLYKRKCRRRAGPGREESQDLREVRMWWERRCELGPVSAAGHSPLPPEGQSLAVQDGVSGHQAWSAALQVGGVQSSRVQRQCLKIIIIIITVYYIIKYFIIWFVCFVGFQGIKHHENQCLIYYNGQFIIF